jgi:hypothetical protein
VRLKIVQAGEPVLRQTARLLTSQEIMSDDTQRLVRDVQGTTRDAPGIGLAAPQIGLPLQLVAMCGRAILAPITVATPGCHEALARSSVCTAANAFAENKIKSRRLVAVCVVQDVRTGALVLFAASESTKLDVSTPVLPLSLSKLFLAASWWDLNQPNVMFESIRGTENAANPAYRKQVNAHEILVGGSDSAGKQMAVSLRKAIGTEAVINDLHRYGFNTNGSRFSANIDLQWRKRLMPPPAIASLSDLNDDEWGAALSIGESHMSISALQVSAFLQAIGNEGVMCSPVAFDMKHQSNGLEEQLCIDPTRIVSPASSQQLVEAMLDTVRRGTARGIADSLKWAGWSIGGKTGTGGRSGAPLNEQDGWFAGLIFNSESKARFTVATFVLKDGLGGGAAAEISVDLAHFLARESLP